MMQTSRTTPPDALRARVLGATREAPSAPRHVVVRRSRVALTAGFAVTIGVLAATGSLGPGRRSVPYFYAAFAGWWAITCAAIVATRRRPSILRPSRAALVAAAALTPAALFAWAAACAAWFPEAGALAPYAGPRAHAVCFALTSAMGVAPLVALLWGYAGKDPVHPAARGAALGATTGAFGALLVTLHCDATSLSHVSLGHAFPVVALATIGAVAGGRALAVRPDRS